jgi:hypothetical protein
MDSTSPVPDGFSVIKVGRAELVIKDLYRDRLMGRKIHNPEALFRQHKDKARFMEGRGFLVSLPMDEKGSERPVISSSEALAHFTNSSLPKWQGKPGCPRWRFLLR